MLIHCIFQLRSFLFESLFEVHFVLVEFVLMRPSHFLSAVSQF